MWFISPKFPYSAFICKRQKKNKQESLLSVKFIILLWGMALRWTRSDSPTPWPLELLAKEIFLGNWNVKSRRRLSCFLCRALAVASFPEASGEKHNISVLKVYAINSLKFLIFGAPELSIPSFYVFWCQRRHCQERVSEFSKSSRFLFQSSSSFLLFIWKKLKFRQSFSKAF